MLPNCRNAEFIFETTASVLCGSSMSAEACICLGYMCSSSRARYQPPAPKNIDSRHLRVIVCCGILLPRQSRSSVA